MAVAIQPWVGYETLYLARDLKWLPPWVQLRECRSMSEVSALMLAGETDAACLTLDETLKLRAEGLPLSVALVFDVSAGGDMVLARAGINAPADLAGKRLGYEHNALGALVLQKLLEAANLPESALTLINLPLDNQLDAWRRHEVDAVITYEPTATSLMQLGAHRMFDSRQMPDTILDVLAVRRDRVRDLKPVQELVTAHFRALRHLRTHAEDAIFRMAAHHNTSPEEARIAMAGVTMPNLLMNRRYLGDGDARLIRSARNLSSLMVQRRLLAREDDLAQLILPDTLPLEEGQ